MQRLRIDLESQTVASTAYLVPRVMLWDDADASVNVDVSTTATLTTATGNAIVHDSVQLGRPLIYGVAEGVDTINAALGAIVGSTTVTVSDDWKFGLNDPVDLEATDRQHFQVPWAKTLGANKGRKRSIADPEGDEQTEVVITVGGDPNAPTTMNTWPASMILPQTFDIRTFQLDRSTGYGKWYGYSYGAVTTVNEVWD